MTAIRLFAISRVVLHVTGLLTILFGITPILARIGMLALCVNIGSVIYFIINDENG